MLLGTAGIRDVVCRYANITREGKKLSFYHNGQAKSSACDVEVLAGQVQRSASNEISLELLEKLITLEAGRRQIEIELLNEGIIDTGSMGFIPQYHLDTGNTCPFVPTPFLNAVRTFLMVECFKPRNNNVVDLGSGLGIPTFVAQLCGFQATGIELNSDLHQAATHLAGIFPGLPELRQTQIVSADFRKFNLAAFGIVYAYLWDNCLQLDVMQRTLDRLPEGTIVITYGLNSIRLDDPMRKQCDDKRNLLPIFTEETDALRRLRFHQI